MKKIVTLISAIVFTATAVNAQDLMSKKGTPILYEAGDWGIGIDANPILEYFGNAFNNDSTNNSPRWGFTDGGGMTITGLMVKDANNAYRAKVRIGLGSDKDVYKVLDQSSTTNPQAFADDEQKMTYRQITLGAGIQKMRGKGRLRGMYGAEAMIGLGGGKTENTFANPFTATFTSPETAIPGQPNGDGRVTESKQGSSFMFGVRGFIGAEYFFAPKISIAGEFGWGPRLESTGEGETTTESARFDSLGDFAGTTSTTTNTGKSSSFNFDTDNNGGTLRLTLYF